MKDKIAEWYSSIISEASPEYITKIITTIESVADIQTQEDLPQMIHIFYGMSDVESDAYKKLLSAIREVNPAFTLKSNSIELQLIAGACLYYIIFNSEQDDDLKIWTCYAILSVNFPTLIKNIILTDLLDEIKNYLSELSLDKRDGNLDSENNLPLHFDLKTSLPDLATASSQFQIISETLNEFSESINTTIKSLKEETNILWWLFSNYSNEMESNLSDESKVSMTIILAKEISDLTLIIPGPISINGILSKALSNCSGDNDDTLGNVINSTSKEWKSKILKFIDPEYISELTPISMSIYQSQLTDDEKDWFSVIKKRCGISVDKKTSLIRIAYQFYLELSFNRLMKAMLNE